tara:strand:- start:1079 stop:1225 length:147 start_codon:yes stop_codon:yes gene_type:complete
MNEPKKMKIETPIGSIESDSGNHFIDIMSVGLFITIGVVLYKKWLSKK